VVSNVSHSPVVVFEPHQVNEVDSVEEHSLLVVSARAPLQQILIRHVGALVDEAIVLLVQLGGIVAILSFGFKSQSGSTGNTASADLSEKGVAVAAALLDCPELVAWLSGFSLEAVQLHLAEVLRAAGLYD